MSENANKSKLFHIKLVHQTLLLPLAVSNHWSAFQAWFQRFRKNIMFGSFSFIRDLTRRFSNFRKLQ